MKYQAVDCSSLRLPHQSHLNDTDLTESTGFLGLTQIDIIAWTIQVLDFQAW